MPNIDPILLLQVLAVLLVSLSVHEAAHAWSAEVLGDPTARRLGRVSLNPAVHIDPIGTIVFPLVALYTGLPVLGWAKPVPVDPRNLSGNWKQKYMLIAAAGPASNLVLAVLAAILLRLLPGMTGVESVLVLAIRINVLLAVFNMVPVPPLDGGNVLSGLLRGTAGDLFDRVRPYGFLVLYGLLLTGMLTAIITPPTRFILSVLL